MCGRFALTLPHDAMRRMFEAGPTPGDWPDPAGRGVVEEGDGAAALAALDKPRFNIRPTETIPAVVLVEGERRLVPMRWGFLPQWAKSPGDGPPLINARSETVAEKPAFKKSARERRCLVAADGFYEWRAAAGRGQEPHWIHPAGNAPLVFGAVWRVWEGHDNAGTERAIPTLAIVTTAASEDMAALHERLPLRLAPEDWALWLGEEGHGTARLMQPPEPGFYAHHPVSKLINKGGRAAPDGPELQLETEPGAPLPPGDEGAIGTLL